MYCCPTSRFVCLVKRSIITDRRRGISEKNSSFLPQFSVLISTGVDRLLLDWWQTEKDNEMCPRMLIKTTDLQWQMTEEAFSGWRRSSSERHQSSSTNFIMALCSIRDGGEIASVIPLQFQKHRVQKWHLVSFSLKKKKSYLKNFERKQGGEKPKDSVRICSTKTDI